MNLTFGTNIPRVSRDKRPTAGIKAGFYTTFHHNARPIRMIFAVAGRPTRVPGSPGVVHEPQRLTPMISLMFHVLVTITMLSCANVFMTLAWYFHLTHQSLAGRHWMIAALASWGIASLEYLIQVPANRIGQNQAGLTLSQLKIMQEVITLVVFVPVAVFLLGAKVDRNYFYAALCISGAVYFVMRTKPV